MLFIFHLRSSTLPLKCSPKCAPVLTRIMHCTIVHIINLVESVFVFLPPAFSAMSRACWEQQVIQVLSNESGQAAARGALLFRQGDLDATPGGGASDQARPPGSDSALQRAVHLRRVEVVRRNWYQSKTKLLAFPEAWWRSLTVRAAPPCNRYQPLNVTFLLISCGYTVSSVSVPFENQHRRSWDNFSAWNVMADSFCGLHLPIIGELFTNYWLGSWPQLEHSTTNVLPTPKSKTVEIIIVMKGWNPTGSFLCVCVEKSKYILFYVIYYNNIKWKLLF